jgi:carbamoyl-phosphate synthase large subunit
MNPDSSLRIAVTGLGRGENPQPGAAVIASLRRRWPDAHITGLVYDALESGVYAPDGPDAVFTLPYPSVGVESFLTRLDEIRAILPFEVLIPTLDADMEPMLALNDELRERGMRVLLPEAKAFKARHKHNLPRLAEKAGVITPRTVAVNSPGEAAEQAAALGLPVFIKGPYYDAARVATPQAAQHVAARLLADWGGPVLVQELVDGDEFNVIAIGDGQGGVIGSCAVRKLIVSSRGKGYAGITVCDAELQQAVAALVRELRWRGPLEGEFIRSRDGVFHLIEINPRFPAWADFPSAVGANLAAAAVEQLLGWPVTPLPDVPAGKLFIRHNIDLACDAAEFGRLAAEGRLLRSRHLTLPV